MPEYNYIAKDSKGKNVRGTLAAASDAELLSRVKGQGLFLVSYSPARAREAGFRMTGKELSQFNRELGTMLSSGITLLRAIEIMLKRDIPHKHRKVYGAIYTGLLSGTALSDAMEEQGRVFPRLLTNMYRAAEANGTVDITAMRMAEHYEKEHRLQNKVKSATTYPLLLLALTIAVLVAVFTFVLPQFMDLYGGRDLPGITRVVIGISRLFTDYLALLLLGIATVALAAAGLLRLPTVRMGVDRLKLRLPVFGRLQRIIITARFARTLSSLYASGLAILTCLEIAGDTLGNAYIQAQFKTFIGEVRDGSPLSAALERVDGFDKKLAATVSVGEESGRLEAMLLSVADSFDYESTEAVGRMVTLLEPLLICVMAVLIGAVMIAVMLPIYDMYGDIGGGEALFDLARSHIRL